MNDQLEKPVHTAGYKGATRFQVKLPMRFRLLGERIWHEGWVENMSSTEMLFRTDVVLKPGNALDLRVALPSRQRGSRGGAIVARGQIMHCLNDSNAPDEIFATASLSNPRLLHCAAESTES